MTPISFKRHRFSPEIIQHAVWLYARFTLSFRDVEDLLAERGIEGSNETVRRWFLKFGFPLGGEVCWPKVNVCGPVLFAVGEGRASIANRVRAWSKKHFFNFSPSRFFLADPVPHVSEELSPFIDGALAASPGGYKLVVRCRWACL